MNGLLLNHQMTSLSLKFKLDIDVNWHELGVHFLLVYMLRC